MKFHPARLLFLTVLVFLAYVWIASFVRRPPVVSADSVILAGWIDSTSLKAQYRYQNGWVRDGRSIMIPPWELSAYRFGQQVMTRGVIEYVPDRDQFQIQKPEIKLADFPRSKVQQAKIDLYTRIYAVRDWFLAGVSRALPEPYGAFVDGILVGARSNLPPSIKTDFARTSTSHIIAVSGFNVTIIVNVISGLALLFMRRTRAFWACIIGLFLFMILTGAQASVVRATIMGVLLLLSQRMGRLPTPLHTLVLTAGIMVALDTRILRYDIGFQLSFLATAGILLVSPLLEARIPFPVNSKLLQIIRETFIMTTSAQLCVVPLLIYYFKTFSVLSLPVNLIILPFIPYAMLLGAVAGIGGALVPALARILAAPALILSFGVLKVIHAFSSISWSVINITLSWSSIALLYLLLAIGCFLMYHSNKHARSHH